MHGEFGTCMIGKLNYFLGLQIKQLKEDIFINLTKYIKELIKKFNMEDAKTTSTPLSTSTKLDSDEGGKSVDIKLYKSMIGPLLYLTANRPNIMLSVC